MLMLRLKRGAITEFSNLVSLFSVDIKADSNIEDGHNKGILDEESDGDHVVRLVRKE